jgi:hypothetical protein
MQVLKQISASVQAPPSQAVTNAGTFAVQATEVDGGNVTLGAKADAKSTATDTTAITIMQVLKQISASVQAPPSQAVTNAGTFAVQAAGDVAADSADSGNPVKVGGKAVDIGANGTDVSANDRSNAYFLRSGQQIVIGGHQNIVNKAINVSDADGAQTDTALITVSAGTAIVVTMVQVYLDAATTATGGVQVRIGFGTANTPSLDANTGTLLSHSGIAAGSGAIAGNGGGIVGMGASNEDVRLTCEDPVGGNLDVIIHYFTIAIG